jgi:hypothetical protein
MFLYFSRAIAAISARSSLPRLGAINKAAVAPTTAPPRRASSTFDPVVIVGLVLWVNKLQERDLLPFPVNKIQNTCQKK